MKTQKSTNHDSDYLKYLLKLKRKILIASGSMVSIGTLGSFVYADYIEQNPIMKEACIKTVTNLETQESQTIDLGFESTNINNVIKIYSPWIQTEQGEYERNLSICPAYHLSNEEFKQLLQDMPTLLDFVANSKSQSSTEFKKTLTEEELQQNGLIAIAEYYDLDDNYQQINVEKQNQRQSKTWLLFFIPLCFAAVNIVTLSVLINLKNNEEIIKGQGKLLKTLRFNNHSTEKEL